MSNFRLSNFVASANDKNILTAKISRSTVHSNANTPKNKVNINTHSVCQMCAGLQSQIVVLKYRTVLLCNIIPSVGQVRCSGYTFQNYTLHL